MNEYDKKYMSKRIEFNSANETEAMIEKQRLGILAENNDRISAIPRNEAINSVADFVKEVRAVANRVTIPDFVPLLGDMGVGDLFIGQAPEEIENIAYGNMPFEITPMGDRIPRLKRNRKESFADAALLGVDATAVGVPVAKAASAGVRKAGQVVDQNKEVLRPVGSIRMGGGDDDVKKLAPNKVIKLNTQKKKKEEKFRDESSGHAADNVAAQFGPQAHKMNTRFDDEFTPDGYSTFSADIGDSYENLKYFISSRKGTKEFNEEVAFYRKLFEIKDNPDAEITVYRASPTDDLRYGDLITPIKSDAESYVEESKITREDIKKAEREQRLSGNEPVDLMREKNIKIIDNLFDMFPDNTTPSQLFSYKVKAKDIRWDGNNGLIRWGYFPTGEVKNISKGAANE